VFTPSALFVLNAYSKKNRKTGAPENRNNQYFFKFIKNKNPATYGRFLHLSNQQKAASAFLWIVKLTRLADRSIISVFERI
jgi:hypothetical protein